jgi:hypothetical protein
MGVDSFLESINYLSFIKILSIIFSENPCYCTCTEQNQHTMTLFLRHFLGIYIYF